MTAPSRSTTTFTLATVTMTPLTPEDRDALHPTTSQLFKTFERLSTYAITEMAAFARNTMTN